MNRLTNRVRKLAAVMACAWGVSPALADWTYDAELNTVTVGDWVFNSAVEEGGIALMSLKTAGAATSLDFSTCATAGAPKIVRAADFLLCASGTYITRMPNVTDLVLPDDMVEIGYHAFRNATKLQRVHLPKNLQTLKTAAFMGATSLVEVEPFLPRTLTTFGCAVFDGDTKLRGNLVFSNPELVVENYTNWRDAPFYNTTIDSVDFTGTRLTTLPQQMFRDCKFLIKIVLPETFTEYSNALFYQCSPLQEVWFASFPVNYDTYPNAFYKSGYDYKTRFCYPVTDEGWNAFIAQKKSEGNFVSWDDAGATNRKTYTDLFADGMEPIGYTTFPDKDGTSNASRIRWLVPYAVSAEGATLSVSGSPVACTNVTPTCGTYEDVTEKVTCTAEQYATYGTVLYESIGYRWDVLGERSLWVEGEPVYGSRETEFDKTDGIHMLVWLWVVKGYQVSLSDISAFGTVERPVPFYGEDYYETNSVITLTPVPADAGARFVRWDGDVAEADRAANPLTLTVDRAKGITPVFSRDWTYDETAGTISDGYWTLSVTGDRTALTVVGPAAGSDSSWAELYLGKPIIGGGRIVEIGAAAFRELTTLKIVTLPENLIRLDAHAFYQCSQLETVTPFLPSTLEYLGASAFNQTAKLVQDLKLNCAGLEYLGMSAGSYENQMFYGSGITSVDMSGSGITNISGNVFRSCRQLKWVKLPERLQYIGGGAFMENPELESVTPFLPASLTYLGDSAFTRDTKLAGDLVLSNPQLEISGDYMIHGGQSQATFYGTCITSADLTGSRIECLPEALFRNCAQMKTFIFSKTYVEMATSMFANDTSLADIRFRSFPRLGGVSSFFHLTPGDYRGRIVYPRGNTGWETFISTNETFVAWEDAGDATNTYYATFADRWRPAGYVTVDDNPTSIIKWLVPRAFGAGMMVLVR